MARNCHVGAARTASRDTGLGGDGFVCQVGTALCVAQEIPTIESSGTGVSFIDLGLFLDICPSAKAFVSQEVDLPIDGQPHSTRDLGADQSMFTAGCQAREGGAGKKVRIDSIVTETTINSPSNEEHR